MKIRYSDKRKVFNVHTDGIPYISFEMFDRLGVPNLYSTRYKSYDSILEEGVEGLRTVVMKTDDVDEAAPVVHASRDRLARQIGSSLDRECITDQEHTSYVFVAREEDLGPVWPGRLPRRRQFVDGIVTDVPEALLTAYGGDCPMIYIIDPVRRAVGLVHVGWKGTLGRIPAIAVDNMILHFGCNPADMYAAIGPGICRDCYEMGNEVYAAFASEWSRSDAEIIMSRYPAFDNNGSPLPGGRYHLDLRAANRLTLIRAGIPREHIELSNVCTRCNSDIFYSYRAGRMENEQVAMLVNDFR